MKRPDGRKPNQLRKIKITKDYMKNAEGSCLIEFGETKVICTASVEEGVPPFLKGSGKGWVTAEYGMLPRSCTSRIRREKTSGRTEEIQRLVGRSLRSVVDMDKLGERTIRIDCDVLQGDGGTRTASITGGFIALADALMWMHRQKMIDTVPVKDFIAAISVGVYKGVNVLDLNYIEDSKADVDMNIVMVGHGEFVEVQGTGEGSTFSKSQMQALLALAHKGIKELLIMQKKASAHLKGQAVKELVVASRNKGKVKEIIELLAGLPYKVTSLLDYPHIPEIIEDGKTYRANAFKKAREVALATGKMAMSDDSGIEVKVLGNAPGIYSARFAGEGASEAARNRKLFKMLKGVPYSRRQARYRCVIALVNAKGQELGVVQGTCSGYVTTRNIGNNGFGFDPLFLLKRYNKTFGQLPPSLKAKISHRARALRKIRLLLDSGLL